tara:strand:+ start:500 stop:712 length:213 start_codon:yes stop_codon:yes gene_type:complete
MAKAIKARGQKPHGGNERTKQIPLQTGLRVCFRIMNLKELAMDLKRKMKKLAINLQKRTIREGIISLTFA